MKINNFIKIINIKKLFFIFFILFSFNSSYSQNININNNIDIDFSWQVLNSYVFPFYEGRPLPGEQSSIKLMANIKNGNNSNFYFDWYINDTNVSSLSGLNKNIIKFDLDQLENKNIINLKLYSDTSKNNLIADKSINISAYNPLILMYKQNTNPLIMYNNSINKKFERYELNIGEQLNILIEPFYFSINDSNLDENKLNYSFNPIGISGERKTKNTYNIKIPKYQYGDLSLEIKISNIKEFLQEAIALLGIRIKN